MKDVLGHDVCVNDVVCHVSRRGSHMSFSERVVAEVHPDHIVTVWIDGWDKVEKRTKVSTNFVVIRA